ncbi:response regulator [Desulfopila aestuarii]|uniref:PAS domain S-box-containing protein n=1 Tax=Desulfopila aestuarii DSM 18488 TaxID=1121416 RepID=A0A1M7YE22_9BACT|nr:PAS domain-containing protein [Desulfopila aestuarii]SHO50853.1 PAS domain S-box-containing protein [Desulfopila aestuarii DSM 18488]
MPTTALVVDNNPVILKLLTHTLQQRGIQVRTAGDGLFALEVLDSFTPDIIFTDLIMPFIGGEKLCRIVSSKEQFAKTVLVVVSAIALEEQINFRAFGAHACLAKGPAKQMAANIDLVLSLVTSGRVDLLTGMKLGAENLVHRAMTKELLAAKHHLQLLLENTDNGYIEFIDNEKIVACNSFITRLFRRDETVVLGHNLRELFTDTCCAHVLECLDQFQVSRTLIESTRSVRIGDRDLVFRLTPLTGSPTQSSTMVLRDITEEKQARKQLKDHLEHLETLVAERTRNYEIVNRQLSEQVAERERMHEKLELVARQWTNTFDTISDFVSVHDKDQQFVRVNRALANFLGKDPADLIGKYCYKVMHGLEQPWPECPHLKALQENRTITFEVNDHHIGVPLLVTCSPLKAEDGSLLGSVHVARDISEQKKATNEREKLIKALEENLAKVKLLSGFLPICAACKKIRDDKGYWQQVEEYIRNHSEAEFSHSICPTCANKLYPGYTFEDD